MSPTEKKLMQRIDVLEKQIKDLKETSSLPYDFIRSLDGAGFPRMQIRKNGLDDDPTYKVDPDTEALVMGLPVFWGKIHGTNYFIPIYVKAEFVG